MAGGLGYARGEKMKIRFSIIIPVYNVREYLRICLDSVFSQAYENYEVILINDGSTDGSEGLCDEFAAANNKVRVIHKQNGGLASARNCGIKAARGEYLLFLDSDDFWNDKSFLREVSEVIDERQADIVSFQHMEYCDGSGEIRIRTNNVDEVGTSILSGTDYIYRVLRGKKLFCWYAWLYAVSRKMWINGGFSFDESLKAFEDVELIYRVLLYCERVAVLQKPCYGYRVNRKGSLTNKSARLAKDILTVTIKNIRRIEQDSAIALPCKKELLNNFSHFYYMDCIMVNYIEKKERDSIVALLEQNRDIIEYTRRGKDLIVKYFIKAAGVKAVVRLLDFRRRGKKK